MELKYFSLCLASASAISVDPIWEAWKERHNFNFGHLDSERQAIFNRNKDFVIQHNQKFELGQVKYQVSLNKFAHLDQNEFREQYLTNDYISLAPVTRLNYNCDNVNWTPDSDQVSYPEGVSYVPNDPYNTAADNRVTMVKDQGSCGSCWSFGASAAIEQILCQNGKYDCTQWSGLSTQQMVDCASNTRSNLDNPLVFDLFPYDNHACNGGLEPNAMRYVVMNGGQQNWDDYPYVSGTTKVQGTCVYDASKANLDIISGCKNTVPNDETNLAQSINVNGVHSIAIDAGGSGFQLYDSGVYHSDRCSSTRLNHAVTGTGYGVADDGTPFWQIKNSWSADWGLNGYIQIERNAGNMCGVATEAHFVYE